MSVNAISSAAGAQVQSLFQQQRDLFAQLQQSLSSGDLTGAQKAFKSLQQLLQTSQLKSGAQNGTGSQLQKDFQALGQALQSGDLAAAQNALTTLKTDLQAARQAHHAHQAANTSSTNTPTSNATDSDGDNDGSGGNTVQIVANGTTINVTA